MATRAERLWSLYRLRLARYVAMLEVQGGECSICGRPETKLWRPASTEPMPLAVDHDHRCCNNYGPGPRSCGNCIRGVLCARCNGWLIELEIRGCEAWATYDDFDPDWLHAAVDYLLRSPVPPQMLALVDT